MIFYFLSSTYIDRLYPKLQPFLGETVLCKTLDDLMLAKDDRVVIDMDTPVIVPIWMNEEQIIKLTSLHQDMISNDIIYKYQSYIDIMRRMVNSKTQLVSVISDEMRIDYAITVAESLISHQPVVLCDFLINTKADLLFDLHTLEPLNCAKLESYLTPERDNTLYHLSLFRSLKDFIEPPIEDFFKILDVLLEKYHVVLNLIPYKSRLDYEMMLKSDQVVFMSSQKSQRGDSMLSQIAQLRKNEGIVTVYIDEEKLKTSDLVQSYVQNHVQVLLPN